jgi:hypothetical protein
LTGAEAEGGTIPKAVPIEGIAPETQGAAGAAPEPAEVASGGAPAMAGEERDNILPESTLEVVVCSPKIQDAEPIHSAPMSGAATSSRHRSATNLCRRPHRPGGSGASLGGDVPGRAMDEGELSVPLSSRSAIDAEYPCDNCCLLQDVVERSRQKSDMLQGYDNSAPGEGLGGTTRKGPEALRHAPVET